VDAIEGLRRALAGASNRIEGHPIPAAARQGDFIPQNILVDGTRIGVVDFESFSEADSIYEDVGTFVAYLQALSALPYYSQKALERLAASFLRAYGLEGDEVALGLYRARALVVFMSEIDLETKALFGRRRLRSLQAQLQQICVELDVADTARTVGG
jgi:aminoglycoside phosphotransferase (APT) family kinase protein